MLILKCETFKVAGSLTKFVNENNIAREDILKIVYEPNAFSMYVLFYYAEGVYEKKEKKEGTWF